MPSEDAPIRKKSYRLMHSFRVQEVSDHEAQGFVITPECGDPEGLSIKVKAGWDAILDGYVQALKEAGPPYCPRGT
jgi:hypothetical protein